MLDLVLITVTKNLCLAIQQALVITGTIREFNKENRKPSKNYDGAHCNKELGMEKFVFPTKF